MSDHHTLILSQIGLPRLRAMAFARSLRPTISIDEAEAEGLFALVRAAPRYDAVQWNSPTAFASKCIDNAIRGLIRKAHATTGFTLSEWHADSIDETAPELHPDPIDLRPILDAARLTATQRRVIELRHFEGMEWKRVAAEMGVHISTAKQAQMGAFEKLRRSRRLRKIYEGMG